MVHKALLAPAALAAFLALASVAAAAPPVASFSVSPQAPLTLETVTFRSTSTGGGTYAWDLDGDGQFDDAGGSAASRSFPIAGVYRVGLRATNSEGDSSQNRNITIANRAPTPALTWFPDAPQAGSAVNLVSTAQDADGRVLEEKWDLDADGAFDDGSGPSVTWTFASAGSHLVRLRTVDDRGADAVAERALVVAPKVFGLISPFPVVRLNGTVGRRGTLVRRLVIEAPPGSLIEIRCAGPGCRERAQRRGVASAARTLRFRRFERRLRPRAALRVYVTKPDTWGKYSRFWFRRRRAPARRDLCLAPNSKTPVACPGG